MAAKNIWLTIWNFVVRIKDNLKPEAISNPPKSKKLKKKEKKSKKKKKEKEKKQKKQKNLKNKEKILTLEEEIANLPEIFEENHFRKMGKPRKSSERVNEIY